MDTNTFVVLQFNDEVKIKLFTSSFLYKNSSFLQLFDIEEDNNIPIICPSSYVLDDNNAFYFNDKTDLLFMFTLDTTIFINLCHFLDIIEYETYDINKEFILYVMKHNIIHQLKDLHVFMRGEIKSILNYVNNESIDIQIRICTPLFYSLYLSIYKEEVIKNNRIDIYEVSLNKHHFYKHINKYDNHLTYIIRETQQYKNYIIDISNQLLNESNKENNLIKIKELIEYGANINMRDKNGNTILLNASYIENNLEVIQYLIEHGANINMVDNKGNTTLHIAVSVENNIEVVQYLIEYGAAFYIKTYNGDTLLHSAVSVEGIKNNLEVIKFIIKYNNKHTKDKYNEYINTKNNYRNTALYDAISNENNINVIKYLVEHGADVNLHCTEHETALHKAACYTNLELIAYLLEHGADTSAQDYYYENAYYHGLSYAANYTDNPDYNALEYIKNYKK